MKKIDIDGTVVSYKNVSDLHQRVREVLVKVRRKREAIGESFGAIRKKERSLEKFLGDKDQKESSIS